MSAFLHAHRRSLLWLFAIVAIAGGLDVFRMPVGLFPVIDFPRIVVSVDAGERPIDRMVTDVTRPLEEAVRAVPHVRTVRSASSRGSAEISLSFDWGVDMNNATLLTQARLTQALPGLPPGVSFTVRRMDPTVFPVLGLSLTSKTRDLVGVRDVATLALRPLLTTIEGVASVEVLGGAVAEVQVVVDPMQLQAHGIGIDDVIASLKEGSAVEAVGRVEDRDRLFLVVADAGLRDLDEVRALTVRGAASHDAVIKLSDVADVSLGAAPQWTRVTADGTDAVLVNIMQQRDGNTLDIADAVAALVAAHKAEWPADVVIKPYYDQGELVRASSTSVRDAILLGGVFAAVVLFLFLRNIKVTLVIAIVLPGVLASTVLLLDRLGMSLNIMTLGGMAAATGLIVDDAVVIIEHIARRLAERRAAQGDAVLVSPVRAGLEMFRPLTGSSLATTVVFVPLAFLGGVAGGFFKALALTIAVSLTLSYVVALVAVPLMADAFLDERTVHPPAGRVLLAVQSRYERVVRALLRRRWLVLVVIIPVLVGGALSYRAVGQGFLPTIDEGGFIFDYTAPPGMSLSETDRLMRVVEKRVVALPELDSYSRRTGLQLGGGLTESNTGDMFVHLKPRAQRRGIEEVMSDLRNQVQRDVPGLRVETAQLMEDLIGDLTAVPQPVEVKLFGADERALESAAQTVADKLEKVPGCVEVFNGITIAGDDVVVRVDPVRAGVEGLRAQGVAEQVTALLDGEVAGDFRQGEKTIDVRVWSSPEQRARVDAVGALRLEGDEERTLPLSRVADIAVEEGRAEVQREDLKHMIAVTARIEGRDLASTMTDVKAAMNTLALPPGIQVAYGGVYAEQQKSFRDLALVFASAIVLVTLLLLFLYERWAIVLSILMTTLLSVSCVFIGLWLTNTELNLSSMMGLTMIIGIVTEVAIFFFAELGDHVDPNDNDIVRAGIHRMRPILMTSTIAALALSPLALGLGEGAEMQAPLAIAIICGLIAAVPLVLVVMPPIHASLAKLLHRS